MRLKTPFPYLILIITLVAVLGCSISGKPDPIVVTATPEGGGVIYITATPDYTPTPEPLAVPTLPPEDAITAAERALFNGNFDEAVNQYQTVVNQQFVDSELRASAYYGLGQANLREGYFDQAFIAFSEFIQQFPDDPRNAQAYFQRGDANLGIGSWEAAITDFQKYLQLRPGLIDSYAYERIGDAYLALNLPTQAFENYLAAADATRTLVPQLALRERIAATYINQGLLSEAIAQYDEILKVAQNGGYRASIESQAAQLELQAGNTVAAYARLERIFNDYPSTIYAYQAMQTLLVAGYEIDPLERAQVSFAAEDYGDVISVLNDYSTTVYVMPTDALLLLGQAYRGLGNFDAAFTTLQTITANYPTDPLFGMAWLEQGRTLFLQGNFLGAASHYSQLPTVSPASPQCAEALWRSGYIYATQLNDNQRALQMFDQLGKAYPGDEWAQDGLLLAASIALNTGQTQQAQALYTQLANTGAGENQALAFLWLGRLYRDQGQTDLAQQSFLGASQADPGGYYSLRAQDILAGKEPFTRPANYQFEFDEGQEIAKAEDWLRTTFGIQQAGALYPLSPTLETDPHMIRGRELWALAAFDDAREEFDTLAETYTADPLATYQLAYYFAQIGLYRSSIEAAANLITAAGIDTLSAPGYIARLRYPIYYADLVLPATEKYNLDPLLVFSLIRQESLFQSFATSSAAAQGLMQIIPDTGAWIATQLGWENYTNSDVYRPYVNVEFGTYYLDWTLDLVDSVPYAALAGYNGGPGNAQDWLSIAGPDLDKFVQTITFDETRSYITRIYEQYDIYRALYGTN
ncbi:MAG: tetratricopeptide repeat protein [Chloroflexi bacterium]|nr:tetratricopeptide repeat protein [Chloroflexota bacterium]